MNDKIKLFEMANKKLANDSGFIAYYLKKYQELESVSANAICSELNCSEENYLRLSLCKTPDAYAEDFSTRINDISQHTGVSPFGLSKIIKRVANILKLSENVSPAFLMAARDKKRNNDNDKSN
ncbi:hypothetical protein [Daejeonella sp. JGW-45]|uniref:hypothetical protein n=1 Tax=Daejeonella sp. JGW-45 TaxID=3034148 RepID=UPI0023EE2173|nr:hypothetical protein [Daejeonella sp. JGW-45]